MSLPGEDTSAYVLITGGAGFIGTNLAARLASSGRKVLLFDNLIRPGVEDNVEWLLSNFSEYISVELADIRDGDRMEKAVQRAGHVYHFAAQVAVTTSITDPRDDFEVNALGTINLLEAIRRRSTPPPLVFTSTNKVYGKLNISLEEGESRYNPSDTGIRTHGIAESQPLDFYSPYGCSKGAADQYVLDYSRIYGLPAVVLRMSCIYGPHQFGNEDQGWVAHFLLKAMHKEPLYIFGNGKQVRDILHVSDLIDALVLAQDKIHLLAGNAFNIGGGPENTTSLLELLSLMKSLGLVPSSLQFKKPRPGDQDYYVSDIESFRNRTGWNPKTGVREGVCRLGEWLRRHRMKNEKEQLQAVL
ncbi:MAG: NAD-dependent epimerase/dehydratase family protein [Desulfovibrionales bacterium]